MGVAMHGTLLLALCLPCAGWLSAPEASAEVSPDTDLAPGPDPTSNPDLAAPPEPSPERSAGEWYARGFELGSQGEYTAAAEAFLRSYELKPTSEALFNAAVAHENASTPILAIEAYRRFLAEPERAEELAASAERAIESLLREISVLKGLRYTQDRPPAELYVNGQAVEIEAFPVLVTPGIIELIVVDESGGRHREIYELLAGESLVLDLRALLPALPSTDTSEPEQPEVPPGPSPEQLEALRLARVKARDRARRLRIASLTTLGVAGAAGVTTLSLGLLANAARSRYESETCLEFPNGDCPDGFSIGDPGFHNRNYARLALGTNVMAGVTAGFALIAVVTGAISLRSSRASKRAASVRLSPSLGGFRLEF